MRIVHAISGIDPQNGGPTSAIIGLASAQVRAGLDVRVVATWQFRDAFQSAVKLDALGVGVRMIGPAHGKLSRHPDLAANLEEELQSADVLHIHAVWEEIQHQAARAACRLSVPYVYTPHGMLDPWNMQKNRLAKQIFLAVRVRRNLEQASLLHFTTEIERQAVARMELSPPAMVESLGLNLADFADLPERGTLRKRYPQLERRPIILFLGRIHYGKGLELLVPALAQMQRRDAMLVVAGPDSDGYRARVEQLLANHRVADRVLFTGMITGREKLAALVDADLLAMPSYHENFGLAVIESLAAGTPVIVSDQVNLHPDIAAGGVGGVVPMDVGALARELDRWLNDEQLRRSAADAASAFARQRYDWDAIAQRWVGHYQKVVKLAR